MYPLGPTTRLRRVRSEWVGRLPPRSPPSTSLHSCGPRAVRLTVLRTLTRLRLSIFAIVGMRHNAQPGPTLTTSALSAHGSSGPFDSVLRWRWVQQRPVPRPGFGSHSGGQSLSFFGSLRIRIRDAPRIDGKLGFPGGCFHSYPPRALTSLTHCPYWNSALALTLRTGGFTLPTQAVFHAQRSGYALTGVGWSCHSTRGWPDLSLR